MIREALEDHEGRRLKRLVDGNCEKVILALFEEAHELAKENVCKPIFEVMEQVAVKDFFTAEADELLEDKMYRLAES